MAKFNASLTISKVVSTKTGDYIEIKVNDEDAIVPAVMVQLDMLAFAQAITGLGRVPTLGAELCEYPERIGKKRISEAFSFEVTGNRSNFTRKEAKEYIREVNALHDISDGEWFYDDYLGSKQSIVYLPDDIVRITTRRMRWTNA